MTVTAEWYKGLPDQITAEEYAQLPEDFCRSIEVIDGHVIKCESPSRMHNRVGFNLAAALKAGRKPEPCLMVETDIDVRFSDVPLNFRRPDVTVYRRIPDDARLYSGDTLIVVEIVSLRAPSRPTRSRRRPPTPTPAFRSTSSSFSTRLRTPSRRSRSTGSARPAPTSSSSCTPDG